MAPKLALDLQGGTQITLAAQQTDGEAVSGEQLQQAVSIIRQRVDASGLAEAEITTEGAQNISVSIPGPADDATRQRIEASAKLDFRPVLSVAPGVAGTDEEGVESDAAVVEGEDDTDAAEDVDAAEGAESEGAEGDAAADDAENTGQAEEGDSDRSDVDPDPIPDTAYDEAWLTEGLLAEFDAFECTLESVADLGDAPADRPFITCDEGGYKYILGPVELSGESIDDAVAEMVTTQTGATTGEWAVQMRLDDAGTKTFGEISTRMYGAESPLDQFAFVLDGRVLSAPAMQGQILDGRPSITGGFTQESAKALADQLKFGALPIGFTVVSSNSISATLGSQQLQIGLIAGLIGLVLVAVYSLIVYRVLGFVIIASLAVMGVLTYLALCILAWRMGFSLSLAGVAGLIVTVGFTADSFIVYFERIRDELREGKTIEGAVKKGWERARRTIFISKSINVLAAVVLYILADSTVKGFAFTLGLTTVLDVLIFVVFTHPVMQLLARTRFFGSGHPLSGLDPQALGAVYQGRAQFRTPVLATGGSTARRAQRSRGEAERRQTLAERKRDGLTVSTDDGND
nr:protein translocase subunit SecD [Leucobacter weissii]